jgi:signal transduction histidine kinase
MINSFSHELRTPLNGANNILNSALLDDNVFKDMKAKYIIPCLSSLKKQTMLINDIIDFS